MKGLFSVIVVLVLVGVCIVKLGNTASPHSRPVIIPGTRLIANLASHEQGYQDAFLYWHQLLPDIDLRIADKDEKPTVDVALLTDQQKRECKCDGLTQRNPFSGKYSLHIMRSSLDSMDMLLVTAHEIGHVLGLGHVSAHSCSLMSPSVFCRFLSPNLISESGRKICLLSREDWKQLRLLYGNRIASGPCVLRSSLLITTAS